MNDIYPTHKCRVCHAMWRVNLERDTLEPESWQLVSESCGNCCDNSFMGEQIVPIEKQGDAYPFVPVEPESFLPGDKVVFTLVRAVWASITLKRMEGRIVEFSKPSGKKALIKYHGGNYTWKPVSEISRVPVKPAPTQPDGGDEP